MGKCLKAPFILIEPGVSEANYIEVYESTTSLLTSGLLHCKFWCNQVNAVLVLLFPIQMSILLTYKGCLVKIFCYEL